MIRCEHESGECRGHLHDQTIRHLSTHQQRTVVGKPVHCLAAILRCLKCCAVECGHLPPGQVREPSFQASIPDLAETGSPETQHDAIRQTVVQTEPDIGRSIEAKKIAESTGDGTERVIDGEIQIACLQRSGRWQDDDGR